MNEGKHGGKSTNEKSFIGLDINEDHLQNFVDEAPNGVYIFDDKGDIVFFNKAFRQIFELPGNPPKINFKDFHYQEDIDEALAKFLTFKQQQKTQLTIGVRTFKNNKKVVRIKASQLRKGINLAFVDDVTDDTIQQNITRLERDLALALSRTSSLEEMLNVFLDTVINLEGIDTGGLYVFEGDELRLKAYRNLSDRWIKQTQSYKRSSKNARLVLEGVPCYKDKQELSQVLFDPEAMTEITAMGVLPLLYRGEVIGSLNIASRYYASIPEVTRTFLTKLSNQIGESIVLAKREDELRKNYEDLENLFNSIGGFMWVLDMQGNIIHVNTTVLDRLHYQYHELMQTDVSEVHPKEHRAEALRIVREMLEGKNTACYVPLITKEGEHIPVETKVVAGKWKSKSAIIGMSWDLSQLQQAEMSAKVNEQKFQDVFNVAERGIAFLDERYHVKEINQAFAKILQQPESELLGQDAEYIFNAYTDKYGNKPDVSLMIEKSTPDNHPNVHLKRAVGKNNQQWIDLTLFYVNDSDYNVLALDDITDHVDNQMHIESLNRKLQKKVAQTTREVSEKDRELQNIIQQTPVGLYRTTVNGEILMINPAMLRILEMETLEEIKAYHTFDFYVNKDKHTQFQKQMKEHGRVVNLEARWKTKNNKLKHLIENAVMMKNSDGFQYYEGSVLDITEKKHIENQLLTTQATYSNLIEQAPIGILYASADGEIQYINDYFLGMLGSASVSRTKKINLLQDEYLVEQGITRRVEEALVKQESVAFSRYYKTKWGKTLFVEISITPIYTEETDGIMLIADDKTAEHEFQKQKDTHLKLEETLLNTSTLLVKTSWADLTKNIEEALSRIGQFMQADRAYVFEYHDDFQMMSNTYEWVADNISPEKENLKNLPAEVFPWWNKRIRNKQQIDIPDVQALPPEAEQEKNILESQNIKSLVVLPVIYKDQALGFIGFDSVKKIRHFELFDTMVLQILGDLIINTKIREQVQHKLDEQNKVLDQRVRERTKVLESTNTMLQDEIMRRQELEKKGELLLEALDFSKNGILITDSGFKIHYVNDVLLDWVQMDKDKVIQQHTDIFLKCGLSELPVNEISSKLQKREPWNNVIEIHLPSQFRRAFDVLISPVFAEKNQISNYVIIISDITYRKQLEKELQVNDKMAAVGTMAGSVAHEFNNILQIIMVYRDLIELNQESKRILGYTQIIADAAKRGKDLISSLLNFSRKSDEKMRDFAVRSAVENAVKMVRPLVKAKVKLHLDIQDSGEIYGDIYKIEQIILNLFSNAQKAVGSKRDPEISIALKPQSVVYDHHGSREGLWAQIVIQDNGTGIRKEDFGKIFELFYTTSEVGEGTGIGLATVKKIVQEHQGFIHLTSEMGQGSTFYINLPRFK
ncbi:MAG: PAS domain S-box protein [Bacteroidota bacterium]